MNPVFGFANWADGALQVPGLKVSETKLSQLTGIFRDQQAWKRLDPETLSIECGGGNPSRLAQRADCSGD